VVIVGDHGGERDVLCGMIDLAPTVLDALGLPFPDGWQGRSLLRDWKRERIYFFAPWSHMLFGFREGDMKYIYHAREDRSVAYDLSKDPKEKKNIIKDLLPRERNDIKRKLAAWVQYQARLMADRVVK
jgi:arylsulfatase A-like enzyme